MWSIGPAYYGQRAEGWTTRFAPHLARKLLVVVASCGCLIGKRFRNATTRWSSPFIKKIFDSIRGAVRRRHKSRPYRRPAEPVGTSSRARDTDRMEHIIMNDI